jgi:hypothetical protein
LQLTELELARGGQSRAAHWLQTARELAPGDPRVAALTDRLERGD